MVRGWGGTDRKTDSPCSVFPFSSVRWLVCVRAQTCSAPSEGYLKSRGFLVRLTQEGVEQAFVWVVVMKNAGGGRKERKETWKRRGGWGQRGQRYGCDNSGVTGCILECFTETSMEHKVIKVYYCSHMDFLHIHA